MRIRALEELTEQTPEVVVPQPRALIRALSLKRFGCGSVPEKRIASSGTVKSA